MGGQWPAEVSPQLFTGPLVLSTVTFSSTCNLNDVPWPASPLPVGLWCAKKSAPTQPLSVFLLFSIKLL